MRLALLLALVAAPAVAAPPVFPDDAPLRAVKFVDAKEGWVAGDHGVVFHTIDGGQTWERQPTGTRASLRGLHFLTPYTGWAVGRTELPNRAGSVGVVLTTADGGATWTELTGSLLPGLNCVQFFDEKRGVVAGDGSDAFPSGVFRTEDGGRTWAMLSGPRAASWTDCSFTEPNIGTLAGEFGAVSVTGGKVSESITALLAGSKGEPNFLGGASRPGLARQLMLNEGLGWSVGDMGTVHGTTDGGKSWKVLKAGGQRAAVLFVFEKSCDVPLGAVAALAADGYLCAAAAFDTDAEYRLPAAMRASGGAGATRYGPAENRVSSFTAAFQSWRPDVVVTDSPDYFAKSAAESGVKKVYLHTPTAGAGTVSLNLAAFCPELGDAVKDAVEPAALLLGTKPVPDAVHFKLVHSTLPGAESHKSLMEGIELAEGGTARRQKVTLTPEAAPRLAEREKAAATRRGLEKLIADPKAAGGLEAALVTVVTDVRTLPDDLAARTCVSLGFRLVGMGQWTAARELFATAAEHYPAHTETVEAVRWLVKYQTSGEARRRIELGHFPVFQKAAFVAEAPLPPGVVQASHNEPATVRPVYKFNGTDALRQWSQSASDQFPKLAAFGAGYTRDPAAAVSLAATQRALGLHARAADLLAAVAANCSADWQARLGEELRLLGRPCDFPRLPAADCRFTTAKPFLDGHVDDACWKSASPIELPAATAGYTTTARFACDDKFLYVAVACAHPAGKQKPKAESREYDADLTGFDRVELRLDLDRDYQTCFRLCVDQRGCVADDCWGDPAWNPKWFVAVDPTPTGWTAELAIPLAELSGDRPKPGQPWAVNVSRYIPGTGDASWAGPPSVREDVTPLGLLKFHQPK
ncbi:MAG: YCF48-related protein [Gemmataceae bacterium]